MNKYKTIALTCLATLGITFALATLLAAPYPARANPNASCQLTWNSVATPNVGSAPLLLTGLAAFGENDLWVTGQRANYQDPISPFLARWNGSAWNLTDVPDDLGAVYAIEGSAPDNVWIAAGNGFLRWDGSTFTRLAAFPGSVGEIIAQELAVLAPDNVWSTGYYWNGSMYENFIGHWDGTQWTNLPTPDAGVPYQIYGMDAVSADDIWAVGNTNNRTPDQSILLHWNGALWTASVLDLASKNSLNEVTAIAADDVWAVGMQGSAPNVQPLAVHWNGTTWSAATLQSLSGFAPAFSGADARASDDVWAAGGTMSSGDNPASFIEHWNGSAWSTIYSSRLQRILRVKVGSPRRAWAYTADGALLQWDGAAWAIQELPPLGTANYMFTDVHALAANNVWAVGSFSHYSIATALTEHWDGTSWQVIPTPDFGAKWNTLAGVDGLNDDDVWAVGTLEQNLDRTDALILHWDGTKWTQVATPPIDTSNYLTAVAVVSANNVWAVGTSFQDSQFKKMILHWDGSNWTRVTTGDAAGQGDLAAIAVANSNDIWAAGTSLLHWDGAAWIAVTDFPANPAIYLNTIAKGVTGDVWMDVVVYMDYQEINVILHWDGSHWTTSSPAPADSTYHPTFYHLVALAPDDVYAVGNLPGYKTENAISQHWDGTVWNWGNVPSGTNSNLKSVTRDSNGELWAVGFQQTGYEKYGGLLVHGGAPCFIPTPTPTLTPTMTPTPTPTPLRSPRLRSPQNGGVVKHRRVLLDWSNVLGAQGYEIALHSVDQRSISDMTTTASQIKTKPLVRGKTYVWRVRSCLIKNSNYLCGHWSNTWQFTIGRK